ncbi:MAG: DUF4145 domain-containing protein [Fibrobacteres bacterium]|nr:DUF4145 domain-containing protein [Fibrobacterota bacterium]
MKGKFMEYVQPKFIQEAFNCPHCGAFAHMYWSKIYNEFGRQNSFLRTPLMQSRCAHCRKDCFWIQPDEDIDEGTLILPVGSVAPLPHPDMPKEICSAYEEARNIVGFSPKSSAALLRLCVQKLCKHLGESGSNINNDIKALVTKGLPIEIQQALDIVRVVGNNAVHPGELNDSDISSIAIPLFELVNQIVEDRISRPNKLKNLFSKLPNGAKEAIKKRDSI